MASRPRIHSPWIGPISARLGWHTQRLRDFLDANGYPSPWMDEAKIIRLLEKAGHNVPSGASGEKRKVPPATLEKMKNTFKKKLVPRLARLLPEGDTEYGKMKVRAILKKGGMDRPWGEDPASEARALAIFRARNIPTEGFEYGQATAVAVPNRPEQLSFVPRPQPHVTTIDPDDTKRLQRIFNLLNAYEHQLMELIRKGHLSKLTSPLELPINALNELRSHLKAN